jgi:hypothetical protein
MKGRLLVAALGCAALALPATALGKGATEAKIEGDGLKGAIVFKTDTGGDPSSGSKLDELAQGTGFYAAVFGQQPDPREPARPNGDLGPKYTVTWVMPGPDMTKSVIVQDLYPYASDGRPVTYTRPNQPYFETERTAGGWIRGDTYLKTLLVDAGLPATRPTSPAAGGDAGGSDVPWPALTGFGVLVLGLGAATWLLLRRRTHTAPAR